MVSNSCDCGILPACIDGLSHRILQVMRSCVLTDSRLYLCFFVGLVPNRVPCVLVLGLHLICAFGILDWVVWCAACYTELLGRVVWVWRVGLRVWYFGCGDLASWRSACNLHLYCAAAWGVAWVVHAASNECSGTNVPAAYADIVRMSCDNMVGTTCPDRVPSMRALFSAGG